MSEQHPDWVIARLRSHARRLFWPTLLLLALSGGVGFGYGRLPEEWQNLAILGGAALLALVGCVMPFFRWLARTYTITNTRTILRSGLLLRTRQEVPHARLNDIILRRSAIQLMFGTGDVLLDTGGARPVVLRDVPSPKLVARVIDELLDELPEENFVETSIG